MKLWPTVAAVGLLVTAYILHAFWNWASKEGVATILEDIDVNNLLKEHTDEFKTKEIIKVTLGVHVAVGYAIANTIFIEAPDGLIVVDTTESIEAAKEILSDYRSLVEETRNLSVKAIIYTHNHVDHVLGSAGFVEKGQEVPEIWAHESLMYYVGRYTSIGPITYKRAARQFGNLLPDEYLENAGIGPRLRVGKDTTIATMLRPTKFLSDDEETVIIAGRALTLVHIPGETNDQIGVWLPEQRTFLCADDLYRAFPNLYAIRGTPQRDVMQWVSSIDKIRDFNPRFLVPSHTKPLEGEENIHEILTAYRDAMQFVHDQTVRYINKGWEPAEIAHHVTLPTQLKQHPFLLEFYGSVPWSVRSVFTGYIGWFGGDPSELSPLRPKENSRKLIALIGGEKKVLEAAEKAIETRDFQWGLQLASHVVRVDQSHKRARKLRVSAMKHLAGIQISAPARNYYLTSILENSAILDTKLPPEMRTKSVKSLPMSAIFNNIRLRLKAELVEGIKKTAVFNFTDSKEIFALYLRNSIIEISENEPLEYDLKVTMTTVLWREILSREKSPALAYATGDLVIDGGVFAFKTFMDYFEQNE